MKMFSHIRPRVCHSPRNGRLGFRYRPESQLSTPISGGHRHPSSPHAPSAKITRPKTAAVILGRTECERVHQLEYEPTRRHNLENHLPLKKTKPPPWQKNLESPLVPFQTGPGYILSRSKSKCHVTIRDEFFDPVIDEEKKKSQGDSERDNLIAQLQQQISDLTLYLEEERLNHRQTKHKAEEFLRDKLEQVNSQHQDYIRELQADHQDALHKQRKDMEEEHQELQATLEKQINRMAKEIEFLQGAFESYKSTLHSETTSKWNAKEEELRQKYTEEKQQAMHDFRTKIINERNQERAALAKEHQRAIDTLRKENKREMDALIRRFSNAAADIERLKKTQAELEETKTELEQVKDSYNMTCQQLANTTRILTDTKVRLMEFEQKFQEKVAQVDDKYRNKLQELMTQNTELKRLFIQKCGELFDEKTQADYQLTQNVKSARETMETLVKSRQRANVSIALGGPAHGSKSSKSRPLSAPGTRNEAETAHVSAGEVELQTREPEFVGPTLNLDPNPEIEEMRAELLSSGRGRQLTREELLKSMQDS